MQGLVFGGKPAPWEREDRSILTFTPYSQDVSFNNSSILYSFFALSTRRGGFRSQGASSSVAILGLGCVGKRPPHRSAFLLLCFTDFLHLLHSAQGSPAVWPSRGGRQ